MNRFKNYAGKMRFNSDDYKEMNEAVIINNYKALRTFSFVISGVFLLLILFCLCVRTEVSLKNFFIYSASLLVVLSIYFGCSLTVKKHHKSVVVWMYIFIFIIHAFGIVIGDISQTAHPATSYIVLLFVIPIMFIERPVRIALFNFSSGIVFLSLSFYNKGWDIFYNDLSNFVSFYILGCICGRYFTVTKLQQLKFIKVVENERDTDTFTGVLTKTAFLREIDRLLNINNSRGVLIMIDIDNFKKFNDTYGHDFGDIVIKKVGECMNNLFRQSDLLGRFGGDEFIVFIPSTNDTDIALFRAKSLQMQLAEEVKIPGDDTKKVTLSIGISNCSGFGETYASLFKKADTAIYEAKAGGKNTIVIK